jgi:hypothetical protein
MDMGIYKVYDPDILWGTIIRYKNMEYIYEETLRTVRKITL